MTTTDQAALDPQQALLRARTLFRENSHPAAHALFTGLIGVPGYAAEGFYGLGSIALQEGSGLSRAEESFHQCLRHEPNHHRAMFALGTAAERRDDVRAAQHWFVEADRRGSPQAAEALRRVLLARQPSGRGLVGRVMVPQVRPDQRGRTRTNVMTFRLARHDQEGRPLPPVPIELRGDHFKGSIHAGDWVQIPAFGQSGRSWLIGLWRFRNLTTGQRVELYSRAAVFAWALLIAGVAFLLMAVLAR